MTVAQHQSQEEPDEVRLDGEGNPIDDQPIVERVIDQWPLALVLLTLAIGFAVLAFYDFRLGSIIVGAAVLLGGLLRTVLTHDRAGLLAVRSRPIDQVTVYTLGLALMLIAVFVPRPK